MLIKKQNEGWKKNNKWKETFFFQLFQSLKWTEVNLTAQIVSFHDDVNWRLSFNVQCLRNFNIQNFRVLFATSTDQILNIKSSFSIFLFSSHNCWFIYIHLTFPRIVIDPAELFFWLPHSKLLFWQQDWMVGGMDSMPLRYWSSSRIHDDVLWHWQ